MNQLSDDELVDKVACYDETRNEDPEREAAITELRTRLAALRAEKLVLERTIEDLKRPWEYVKALKKQEVL